MHHALTVNNYLYLVGTKVEKPLCLDELQPLVHESCGVDSDLVAHIPVRMMKRLFLCDVFQLVVGVSEERTARSCQYHLAELFTLVSLQALEYCGMLAVYWVNGNALFLCKLGN